MSKSLNILLTCLIALVYIQKIWWFFLLLRSDSAEGLEIFYIVFKPLLVLIGLALLKLIVLMKKKLNFNLSIRPIVIILSETILTLLFLEFSAWGSWISYPVIIIFFIMIIFLFIKMLINEIELFT